MKEISQRHLAALIPMINRGPYFRLLSMTVKELGKGCSIVEVDMGEKHLNPFGGVHGGVFSSIIDTAAYWSAYCEMDEDAGMVTVDLNVHNLAPAKTGNLTVKGRRIKMGRTICLTEAEVTDETNRILAHGTSKMLVTPGLQTIRQLAESIGGKSLPPKFKAR